MAKFKDRTGEVNIAKNGMTMIIIAYKNSADINIQFSDGVIVYNKTYQNFKKGSIEHPVVKNKYKNLLSNRVGERSTATNGLMMTIINYRRSDDIDIQFSDGIIIKHKAYREFKNGNIAHPDINIDKIKNTKYKNKYINQINTMSNGMTAKIIEYRNASDIDIEFEDSTIIKHTSISKFESGTIKHPFKSCASIKKEKIAKQRLNQESISSNGMKAKIIEYKNTHNITIQFQNGTIKSNIAYRDFINHIFTSPRVINRIHLKECAYMFDNNWYYICSHPDWKEDKILSVKEIYDYKNEYSTKIN